MREAISVEKCVAVTVWKLATNIEYRTLSALYGIGRSTVGDIIIETCKAITKLLPWYVKILKVVKGFEECWGILKQLELLMDPIYL